MRPKDALLIYKRKKEVEKAEFELEAAKTALKEVAGVDPGTPEEWEGLSIAGRFDKLWGRLELLLNDAIYRSGIELEGQTDARSIAIDNDGIKQKADLSFALSRDKHQTSITAYWTFEAREPGGESIKYIEFTTHNNPYDLTKSQEQTMKAELNRFYYSVQAYEASGEVLAS